MQTTRQEILDILKRNGKASVDELARVLQVPSMCIRQHLSVLERDALVVSREERQRLGRPRRLYSLTEQAEELFPKSYHLLLGWILEEIEAMDGREKVVLMFHRLAERMARLHTEAMGAKPLEERVASVAQILSAEGSLAEWEKREDGYLLHEHNCRFYQAALKHRQICGLELAFLSKLMGADVKMLDCLLEAGPRCTYLIRAS